MGRCGSGPKFQVPLEGPPPPPPPRTPPPTPDWAAPSRTPGALQKEPRGVGGRGRERAGREGLWLEGRALQLQWGMGGDPPNTSWGQTHIWGLPMCQISRYRPKGVLGKGVGNASEIDVSYMPALNRATCSGDAYLLWAKKADWRQVSKRETCFCWTNVAARAFVSTIWLWKRMLSNIGQGFPNMPLSWSAFRLSQSNHTRCHPGPSPMPQECPKISPKKRAWYQPRRHVSIVRFLLWSASQTLCRGTVAGTAPLPSKIV